MGRETIEVEHEEVVTKTSKEHIVICDGCGMEIEPEDRIMFSTSKHDIDNIHLCYDCIDGNVPMSAYSPKANPTATQRTLYALEDDSVMFFFLIFLGMCVGANVGWFL